MSAVLILKKADAANFLMPTSRPSAFPHLSCLEYIKKVPLFFSVM